MKPAAGLFAFCLLAISFLNSQLRGQVPNGPPAPPPLGPCRDVTATVVQCDNNNPILIFNAQDKFGNIYSHNNLQSNSFDLGCRLPGYKFTVGASGYITKEHTLTVQEVQNQFAEVCLDPEPPRGPKPPKGCSFKTVLTGADNPEGAAKNVLDLYRTLRDHIALTPIGRELVQHYYKKEVQTAINAALTEDRQLAWDLLVILVEVQPLINSLLQPSMIGSDRPRQPVLDEALAKNLIAFGDKLNQATKGVIAVEIEQINALITKGIGSTASELFVDLQSATVSGERLKPTPNK